MAVRKISDSRLLTLAVAATMERRRAYDYAMKTPFICDNDLREATGKLREARYTEDGMYQQVIRRGLVAQYDAMVGINA